MKLSSYKKRKIGKDRERISFSKVKYDYPLPDLLEVQKKSFKKFLDEGIKEAFDRFFPVDTKGQLFSIEILDYYLGEPRYTIKQCRDRKMTYSAPLMVKTRYVDHKTGEVIELKDDAFFANLPMMTDSGSFVINGAERSIVSQLVRSPSVYYTNEIDKNGRRLINSQLIPTRGTWLEFETDAKGIVYVRMDKKRKVTITTLLRAFGLSTDKDILKLYGDNSYIKNTLEKDSTHSTSEAIVEIYKKLRPGEPATLESSKNYIMSLFFNEYKYELAKVGRYKYNKKLNVLDRLRNQKIAEDVVDSKGKVVLKKDTLVDKKLIEEIRPIFMEGFNVKKVKINEDLDEYDKIQTVKIYKPGSEKEKVELIGVDSNLDLNRLTMPDFFAAVDYYLNLFDQIGSFDEIDHLGNRRIRQVGELLQQQFQVGVNKLVASIREKTFVIDKKKIIKVKEGEEVKDLTPEQQEKAKETFLRGLINAKPMNATINEFFGSNQLSQFMDQINPIAELTHKRRLSALGRGGLSRDRAGIEVRDVNESHYGRICPIESPEGPNIGLITSLASYAKINEYGFITAPYRKVINGKVTDQIDYLTADEEEEYVIAIATIDINDKGMIVGDTVPARFEEENIVAKVEDVQYMDVSAQEIISIGTSTIPFFEHNDATRTLMGTNMQRQGVPLLESEAPIVGTGVEYDAVYYSGSEVISKSNGVVDYVDGKKIIVKTKDGKDEYPLYNYELANASTMKHQRPIVRVGEEVKEGDPLADGPSCDHGELALGKNVKVAFTTWDGYNYEDAVVINEKLVKDDVYTSIYLADYEMQCRDTKSGPEEITRDIPNVSEEARKNLDDNGIVVIGTEVKAGDILVGKVTPKGKTELTAEEQLLQAIFGEKARDVRDTSLRVPNGGAGIVYDVKVFSRKDNDELPPGIIKSVRVYIAQKRKIQVGDKMAGRYGNKGVISLVLPEEDMPYLPDGTPVDILLNPQGVPSRMNLGQILEMHLGMAAKKLGIRVETPAFDGATVDEVIDLMKQAGMREDGKTILYDGRTGKAFDHPITVGIMYFIKLHHMVEDKIHSRATGPYSLVTQQPLGGKAQFGGQRFGEMEVWALEAYGAANCLQEMLTVKSDDVLGRVKVFESIVKGEVIDTAGIPESFRVLLKELQALGLDVKIVDKDDKDHSLADLEEERMTEEYRDRVDEEAEISLNNEDVLLPDELEVLAGEGGDI